MESQAHNFKQRAEVALHDVELQKALGMLKGGLASKRSVAVAAMPEFDAVRDLQAYFWGWAVVRSFKLRFPSCVHLQNAQASRRGGPRWRPLSAASEPTRRAAAPVQTPQRWTARPEAQV